MVPGVVMPHPERVPEIPPPTGYPAWCKNGRRMRVLTAAVHAEELAKHVAAGGNIKKHLSFSIFLL